MTTQTVPLIDGAFYWVMVDGKWVPAEYDLATFWTASKSGSVVCIPIGDLAAISGPIPTPDERADRSHNPEDDLAPPSPIAAIRFRMEQGGHTQADFARLIGHRGRASEILAGKRDLSKAHIRALVDEWGMDARTLLGSGPIPTPEEPTND